jgi:hypothetical protein
VSTPPGLAAAPVCWGAMSVPRAGDAPEGDDGVVPCPSGPAAEGSAPPAPPADPDGAPLDPGSAPVVPGGAMAPEPEPAPEPDAPEPDVPEPDVPEACVPVLPEVPGPVEPPESPDPPAVAMSKDVTTSFPSLSVHGAVNSPGEVTPPFAFLVVRCRVS